VRNSRKPDPSTEIVLVSTVGGTRKVEKERTQHMRVARSNRSGIQLREPSNCEPEQRLARLSLCVDDSSDIQRFRKAKGSLDSEVCWDDLICVTINK
jgi:hypothetical protein